MAEALLAISLVANVLQFIDVGTRFVSTVWKFYNSRRQGLPDFLDVHKTTKDLEDVLHSLKTPNKTSESLDGNESGLQDLVNDCDHLASELLYALQKIHIPEKSRKRDALRVAFTMTWKKEDLRSLQSRLDGFRQELVLHLLSVIRYVPCDLKSALLTFVISQQGQQSIEQQTQVLNHVSAIRAGTNRIEERYCQAAMNEQGIGAAILNALTSQLGSLVQPHGKQGLQEDLITAIYQNSTTESATRSPVPLIPVARQEHLQKVFLDQLQFPGMEDREERIAQAYEKTFQWIFMDGNSQHARWSNFRDWLESDSQLYWITGKAGSGKSTLMKYVCQPDHQVSNVETPPNTGWRCESRCSKYLRNWAGSSQLLTATFFFWNSGVELQMSQRGLLFSLLYQLLRQSPNLIAMVSPKRWETLCFFNYNSNYWTDQELRETLRTTIREGTKNMKVCLFIDGLDEFAGDHNDLISLLQDLIQSRHIKMCVASRPWVVFEDAFKHKPSLMLQDLTFSDITHFVTSKFQGNTLFSQLRRREPKYADQLIENVVSKASGVFLWVHLVVASLLAGMGFGDRVSDLQKRLDYLPSDLERLYDRILQSLDPFYLEHAAQLFKLAWKAVNLLH